MDDRERLLQRLRDEGLEPDAIERASREGRLPTLAVEMALGGRGRHTLTAVASAGIPVAARIAVLRYRLYKIGMIISRTLVYGSLTVALPAI